MANRKTGKGKKADATVHSVAGGAGPVIVLVGYMAHVRIDRHIHSRGRRRVVEGGDAMMRDTLMRSFGTNRAGPRDRKMI